MFRKVVVLSAMLMAFVCLANQAIEAKAKKVYSKSKFIRAIEVRKPLSDKTLLIYSHVFYMAIDFSKQAAKPDNESSRDFLEHFFMKKAGLSAEQEEAFKAIARGFVNATPMLSYRQKIELARSGRYQLRKSFGDSEFKRFDRFVREKIAPTINFSGNLNMPVYGAGSAIYVDGTQLIGTSFTVFYDLHGGCDGTVSATMTGPGVSLSGSGVCGPFDPSVSVTLVSPMFQPGARYDINGQHSSVYDGDTRETHDFIITPGAPPRVTNVEYEQIQTDDLAIDANPNSGGGRRIFADKKIPAEMIDRRRIRVKARHSQTTAGARVYFRNFDVDDPSANSAPIDPETTPNAGNDNNGNVDGTVATRAGQFVIPPSDQPNPYNCQTFSNTSASGVSCETDASGVAKVDFIVTQQPGDNFAVVAGPDETYVSSLTPDADGINLKDTSNIQTPVTTTASNSCANSTIIAYRADMLTVWRRLHIEVDSMGPANANYERGEVDKKTKIGPGKTKTLKVNINANNPLEINRFENGRMELATVTAALDVVSNTTNSLTVRNFTSNNIVLASGVNYELSSQNGTNSAIGTVPVGVTITPSQTLTINVTATPMLVNAFSTGSMFITPVLRSLAVKSNTVNEVEVTNNSTVPIEIEAGTHMRLYDDDDYNRNNTSATLSGDEDEPIVRFADTFRHLSDNLTSGNFPDGSPMNVLASAYILPEYDWAQNVMNYNQSDVVFDENLEDSIEFIGIEDVRRGSKNDEKNDFWLAYFIIAYQGNEIQDHDGLQPNPNPPPPLVEEGAQEGVTGVIGSTCDCYLNPTACSIPRKNCTTIPTGGNTSLVYQESIRDISLKLLPPTNYPIKDTEIAAPHELGHQFGLFGDQFSLLFGIMDYPNNNMSTASRVAFHVEHINLIRQRIKSPGH